MKKYVVTVIVTLIIVAGVFVAGWWYAQYTQSPPAPIALNKNEIVGALKEESQLIVATQDYQFAFALPNEVRQRMQDVAKNNSSLKDVLAQVYASLEDYFVGDYIEMNAEARVVMVVDMGSLQTEDIVQNGDMITITVPPVRVYDVIVNQDTSVPINRDRGVWLKLMDVDELRNEAQSSIRQQVIDRACAQDIMTKGQTAAQTAITDIVKAIVPGKTIVVNIDTAPCALPK
jgi:Na+-transporting NADH:ubiquinone oxidoreductase subunit NqrC